MEREDGGKGRRQRGKIIAQNRAQRGRKSKATERGRKGAMPSLVKDFCLCLKISGKRLKVLSGRTT